MKDHLIIYHGNCADGFTAAWAVWKVLGDKADYHAAVYQRPPPDVTGRNVVFVDFCYKRDIMYQIAGEAQHVLVLDHHESAMKDMVEDNLKVFHIPEQHIRSVNWDEYLENLHPEIGSIDAHDIICLFDMERSGAGITWDFFHPKKPRPALVNHVEDRDLWRFALPGTREIQADIFSYPYDFAVWNSLVSRCEVTRDREMMIEEGSAIERKHFKDIHELVEVVTRTMKIGGYLVPVANLPYTMASDAGHLLCQVSGTFAGCYYDSPDGRNFSLRSDKTQPNAVNVSEIAKQYGGGGHPNASGFRVPFDQLAQFEP